MAEMVFIPGRKGKRSRADVKLSVYTVFQNLTLDVWEEGKITHQFYASPEFCREMIKQAQAYLDYQAHLMERELKAKQGAGAH